MKTNFFTNWEGKESDKNIKNEEIIKFLYKKRAANSEIISAIKDENYKNVHDSLDSNEKFINYL